MHGLLVQATSDAIKAIIQFTKCIHTPADVAVPCSQCCHQHSHLDRHQVPDFYQNGQVNLGGPEHGF